MSDRRTELIEVKEGQATHLKIEIYYSLGGWNYFTGEKERRGLYLSVSPVSREKVGNGYAESYSAFSGTKIFLKEMKRFSQKTLDTFEVDPEMQQMLIDHVVASNGLTI